MFRPPIKRSTAALIPATIVQIQIVTDAISATVRSRALYVTSLASAPFNLQPNARVQSIWTLARTHHRMKLKKYTLWGLLFLPLGILSIGMLVASTYYNRYLNRISSTWELIPRVDITTISPESILVEFESKIDQATLSNEERTELASTLSSWIESQRDGTLDSFISFRNKGLKNGDVAVSEALAYYYQQFINTKDTENLDGSSQNSLTHTDIISAMYEARTSERDLVFRGKRLCLACIKSISLNSLEVKVTDRIENPLNEFMNGNDRLSLESYTGVFEAVGEFRHHLAGLTSRSKTVNISFIVRSGGGLRSAYKCGMQLIWLPSRKIWFPLELMIGYPGDRMPMEAFLF